MRPRGPVRAVSRRSRGSALALLASLMLAPRAHAQLIEPPSPANSTIPASIRLVGRDANGTPDPVGVFRVTVRDLANNPRAGVTVSVDLTNAPDVVLCDGPGPLGQTIVCGSGASVVTGADGVATFDLAGYVRASATTATLSAALRADGELLGNVPVHAFDLDGAAGVGSGDLSRWLTDFGSGTVWARGDYDDSGMLGAGDLSLWLTVFGAGRSIVSCGATACP